ncbi:uncharacterized protein LOC128328223 isoform X2 [Hemicordylus capensis]|uniref:uncharacterized protein LOC128328223 isoform X2 n=1 Tax=Hemicordylus capensis TaxID=884348 RepID=UPI0023040279|nr:uncharacterized protein LOC128328223 isoform X2 [Hemicordylus capensis]
MLIRGLVQRMEALEIPSDKGAGPSGVPKKVPRQTRGTVKTQLLRSLSDRLSALERADLPVDPAFPADPPNSTPAPGMPVPVTPSNPVPDLVLPADLGSVSPSMPVVPDPAEAKRILNACLE